MRTLLCGSIAAVLCFACSSSGAKRSGRPDAGRAAADVSGGQSPAGLLPIADARRFEPALVNALQAGPVETRRTAALALARLHDVRAAEPLMTGLRDPDPIVRANASLGLGALGESDDLGERGNELRVRLERALVGALAAEDDSEAQAALVEDLGRTAGETALPALREALSSGSPSVRSAACRGLGSLGLRHVGIPSAELRVVAARMVDDADVETRLSCAYALTRLDPPASSPDVASAVAGDLLRAARDAEPELRAMALRALGRYPSVPSSEVAALTADADWRVAVAAFRALAKLGGRAADATYAQALGRELEAAYREPARFDGPHLHVLLAAFEAAEPLAQGAAVHTLSNDAFEKLGLRLTPTSRRIARAHCAAAKLVDFGRRWPTRLEHCGGSLVSAQIRESAMAEVLAAVDGADEQRMALLARLYERGDARTQEAVLGTLPKVRHPDAATLVLRALQTADPGIVTAAADAVSAMAERITGGTVDGGSSPTPPAAAIAALRTAHRTLTRRDELEGLLSWLGAVQTLAARDLAPLVRPLADHTNPALRTKARAVLKSLGQALPAPSERALQNPLPAQAIAAAGSLRRAVVVTSLGEITLELLPAEAPTTVARFAELARARFYNGLAFHRVVPAFVVQGGDPRGDGYGGPGWSQRCEDNRVRYERGTVGMALAGRDTGGSQFFIAHGAQPHLDGRYTAFARVTRGMDIVDRLQEGDTIREIRIESAAAERVSRETHDQPR